MAFDNPYPNPILLRMDKVFNENVLRQQLSQHKCIIITDKPIQTNIIQTFKNNIQHIVYLIDENDEPSFIETLRSANISAHLISELDDEVLCKKKINYMEYGIINQIVTPKQDDIEELKGMDMNSLYYLSNGPTVCNFKTFKSISDWHNKLPTDDFTAPSKIIENKEFWKEINGFYILKKKGD